MHAMARLPLPMQESRITPPRIRIGQHQVTQKINRFLCRMELAFVAMYCILDND